jgi:hypothetical protein
VVRAEELVTVEVDGDGEVDGVAAAERDVGIVVAPMVAMALVVVESAWLPSRPIKIPVRRTAPTASVAPTPTRRPLRKGDDLSAGGGGAGQDGPV